MILYLKKRYLAVLIYNFRFVLSYKLDLFIDLADIISCEVLLGSLRMSNDEALKQFI